MGFTKKEIKERSWVKKKAAASMIDCKCGCGEQLLEVDDFGRKRSYISGHNGRKYDRDDKWVHKKAWVHKIQVKCENLKV